MSLSANENITMVAERFQNNCARYLKQANGELPHLAHKHENQVPPMAQYDFSILCKLSTNYGHNAVDTQP